MVFKTNKVSSIDTLPEPKTDDDGTKWKGMIHNSFDVYLILFI
jgi:hypothetical protein